MPDWAESTALIVVDVQKGFDDETFWGPRNNPQCESNLARLIEAWREHDWPVVFVRHDSEEAASPLRTGTPGNEFKDVVSGEPDLLVSKSVHSAFFGQPDLNGWLREHRINGLAVCGIQTNICCDSTARMASDLGYEVLFVIDATHTFDLVGSNRKVYRAREISRYTAMTLGEDFCRVVYTSELVDAAEADRD
jgi:nicotinamidase-related amidase